MRKPYADLIQETTSTLGTGPMTLVGIPGWARFSDRFIAGAAAYYMVENGLQKEVGIGVYNTANILARSTILGTLVGGVWTVGGAPINLSGVSIVRAVVPEALFQTFVRADFRVVLVSGAMVDGNSYGIGANGLTMTLDGLPQAGDRLEVFQAAPGVTGTIIDPAGAKINGVAGVMTIDIPDFAFWLTYVNAAYGWKVQQ